MTQAPLQPSEAVSTTTRSEQTSGPALNEVFDRLHRASRREPWTSYETRMERLDTLMKLVRDNHSRVADAISADFNNRSPHETRIAEIFTLVSLIKYIRKHLKGWMKPQSRHVQMTFQPARAKVHYQPLGVVGVISPWNYPFQLALGPVAYALAAGNRVMLKPSEYTPRTSQLLQELVGEAFDEDVAAVVTGGPDVGERFSSLPFDHLLYTGSTAVGRLILQAAAKNLTPVTLELGGKSPTLVHESFPIERAAERIAAGKWFNAGQTCIAPDYVLAPERQLDALVENIERAVSKSYPTLADNRDYTAIVDERHHARLRGLIEDAEHRGARVREINPAGEQLDPEHRKIAPTLLLDVNDEMKAMQEEIFGPVLPIKTYRNLDEALGYINDHPRPLALYYFDHDASRAEQVITRTISGGASINETVFHFAVDDLPFGGVGPSGMGAYHGVEGFHTFSHKKSVFYQSRINSASLLSPPYGEKIDKLLKMLIGR